MLQHFSQGSIVHPHHLTAHLEQWLDHYPFSSMMGSWLCAFLAHLSQRVWPGSIPDRQTVLMLLGGEGEGGSGPLGHNVRAEYKVHIRCTTHTSIFPWCPIMSVVFLCSHHTYIALFHSGFFGPRPRDARQFECECAICPWGHGWSSKECSIVYRVWKQQKQWCGRWKCFGTSKCEYCKRPGQRLELRIEIDLWIGGLFRWCRFRPWRYGTCVGFPYDCASWSWS